MNLNVNRLYSDGGCGREGGEGWKQKEREEEVEEKGENKY